MVKIKFLSLIIGLTIFTSCGDNENYIPKPPTYLRLDIPSAEKVLFDDECPYTFETSNLYKVSKVSDTNCHKDIDLGPLNGVIHFSYISMTESLSAYVNFANDKVDEHKIKASAIRDTQFLDPSNKVFGTLFELQGDVASPFQFYLTDSVSNFVSGVVYFNSKPNYDSLRPSLMYLKKDLYHLIETFEWQK